jgi:hypothetical protein
MMSTVPIAIPIPLLAALLPALLTLLGLLLTVGPLLAVALLIHLVLVAVLAALIPIRHVVHSCLLPSGDGGASKTKPIRASFRPSQPLEPDLRYCEIATKAARRWQFVETLAREARKSS